MDQLELRRDILDVKEICLSIASKVDRLTGQGAIDEETLLNYLDVCQILHISVRQLRRLQAAGELVGFKKGRLRFFPRSEVQQYIKKLKDDQK